MEHAAFAVRKCPFLSQLAKEHGEEFATSIAIAPTKPVGSEPLPSGTDAVCGLAESFRLFHGPQGVLPLNKNSNRVSTFDGSRAGGCPFHARAQEASKSSAEASTRAAPFATISLSNFGKGPNFGDFLRNQLNKGKGQRPPSNQQRPQRPAQTSNGAQPPRGPNTTSGGSTSSSSRLGASSSSNLKPQRPLGDPAGTSGGMGTGRTCGAGSSSGSSSGSKPPGVTGSLSSSTIDPLSSGSTASSHAASSWTSSSITSSGSGMGAPSPFQQQRLGTGSSSSGRGHAGAGAESKGGRSSSGGRPGGTLSSGNSNSSAAPGCPLRKWLGPAAGLVFNEYDKLVCPPAIVAARAALAKTAAVQQLRPQALPVKLVAVAAVVAGVNMPCGAVREHFEKFSLGWFVAVHATIPFVAMLRKAVIMPKYAMLVTIASAVLGQLLGSRLERARLQYEQQHGPMLLLPQHLQAPGGLFASQQVVQGAAVGQPLQDTAGAGSRTGKGARMGQAEEASSRSSSRHWREKLAADPEPGADGVAATRCGGGLPGGLFARLPLVKA